MLSFLANMPSAARTYFWVVVISIGGILILGIVGFWALLTYQERPVPNEVLNVVSLLGLLLQFVVMSFLAKGQKNTENKIANGITEQQTEIRKAANLNTQHLETIKHALSETFEQRNDTIRAIVREEIERGRNV